MRKTRRFKVSNPILKLFLWLYMCISLYPLVYLIFYSLKTNDEIFNTNPFGIPTSFQWDNYVRAVHAFDVLLYMKNSAFVSVISVAGILLFSLTFAYASARMEWRLRKLASTYMIVGLFVPGATTLIPLAILLKHLHLINTFGALIIPYIAGNLSFSILIFYGFFRTIPKEMEESAFIDGAGIYRTFARIILPLVIPAFTVVLILSFIGVWNEFTIANTFISSQKLKTLPIGLIFFSGTHFTDWGAMGASLVIASIPVIVIYVLFSEQIERALTVGSAVK
ncbi:carbohydrate ABC transporter permease [Paenibacillus sacheonensis]|uniref:carbohydrate ABC transporter permease n=1 Tax=Paenibacillus sacheonensis TaxID=742054 RepID=UPI00308464DE